MTLYLALLRGINVGGHHVIKMAELKQMFEAMGFEQVKTYIQSGNILFESEETDEQTLRTNIENEIKKTFDLTAAVMLRTHAEIQRIIENCPFPVDSLAEGESINVSFLTEAPFQEEIDKLPDLSNEIDEYRIVGREIYLFFRQSIRDSKLPNKLQKLGPATIRNWKTVTKLAALAKGIKG